MLFQLNSRSTRSLACRAIRARSGASSSRRRRACASATGSHTGTCRPVSPCGCSQVSPEPFEVALLQPSVLLAFVETVGLKREKDTEHDHCEVKPECEPVLIPNSVGYTTQQHSPTPSRFGLHTVQLLLGGTMLMPSCEVQAE